MRAPGSIRRFRLANGLRVLALTDAELPLVATVLAYDTGSCHDPEGRCGLAHLVEHLVFRGDLRRRIDYPSMVERRGGQSNAATGHDTTRYTHLLPSHQLSLALWIEAQRLAEPLGLELAEGLERERRVLLQERRQVVDGRPHGRDLEYLYALLYHSGHPYHRPTLGLPDELMTIDEDDIRTFSRRSCRPSGAVLVAVGDLPRDFEEQVERTLGQVPDRKSRGSDGTTAEGGATHPGHDRWQHVAEPVPMPRCYVAYSTDGFGRPAATAAQLAATALALGPRSPLQRALVRGRGLALGVDAMVSPLRRATTLVFTATAAPGVAPRALEEALADEVCRALPRLSEDELAAARRRIVLDHHFRHQGLVPWAESAARWLLWHDRAVDPRRDDELQNGFTHDAMMAWGRALAEGGDRAVLSVLPREKAA